MTKEKLVLTWMIILTLAVGYLLTSPPSVFVSINGKAFLNGEEIKDVSVSTKAKAPKVSN